MKYTLITFDSVNNTLVAKTTCEGYTSLEQFVELADSHGYKTFTVFYNTEHNTNCFEPKGLTTYEDVHNINRNFKEWEQFYE